MIIPKFFQYSINNKKYCRVEFDVEETYDNFLPKIAPTTHDSKDNKPSLEWKVFGSRHQKKSDTPPNHSIKDKIKAHGPWRAWSPL